MAALNRTWQELLQGSTGIEDAIVVPEIAAANFEIKHGLLTLAQNKQFFRHDKEDTHAHIRYFNKITSTLRYPNVPTTIIKPADLLKASSEASPKFVTPEAKHVAKWKFFGISISAESVADALHAPGLSLPNMNALAWPISVAKINLMPLSVFERLNLQRLTKTRMILEVADRLISTPTGIAEDVFVKVGTFYFPADFVVVDYDADPRVPLILGRPFLRTARALIDVTGFSEVLANGNSTPYFEPIVDTTSPTLTPFEGSDFILEEIEAKLSDTSYKSGIDDAACDPRKDILLLEPNPKISGIEVDRAKIDVIAKLPHPTTVKGVRSFLGHAGFYRRFIQNFSKIARPMTHLLEKSLHFLFLKECIEHLKLSKESNRGSISDLPQDWNETILNLCADASDFALGAVLGQRHEKHFRPIHYARFIPPSSIFFAKKILMAEIASRWVHAPSRKNPHENELDLKEINEKFPFETLSLIAVLDTSTPWFADIANYHAGNFMIKGMSTQQKRKFFKDVKHYFWKILSD
ncbi:reverse transcriptase domain-containing protein [Tanacetum coccineum]